MSALTLFAAPAAEPLTLSETALAIKVDSSEEDELIEQLIVGARMDAERITRRALVTQTWDLSLDAFPGWQLDVPKPTLQSVTSIVYVDVDGVTRTLAADQYLVDRKSEPGRIEPAFGCVWPVTRWQNNAVTVRYVCGYGTPADVPAGIKTWMLMRIRTLFENRAQIEVGQGFTVLQLPNQYVDGLLDNFAVLDYGWAL